MWTVILAVAIIFYIGHAVFIPDSFALAHVSSAFSILGLGIVVAFLRAKLKTLHIILVLHLSFYFIFVFLVRVCLESKYRKSTSVSSGGSASAGFNCKNVYIVMVNY